jgi:zinc/manganese transport system ATP-binding protein
VRTPLLRLDDVTIGYGRRPAVHHLNGALFGGDLIAVAGPNGAGKTTLIKALAGALKPLEGRVRRNGISRRDIAYLPQLAELDRSFPIDVRGLVGLGLYAEIGVLGGLNARQHDRVDAAIAAVGLETLAHRTISSLSGGQLQRAMFARVIVQGAQLVLLDEPLNAVDAKTAETLLSVVRSWSGEGRCVVVVLHDFDRIRAHFPTTLLLAREPVAWGETAATLTPENLLRARAMAEGWAADAETCERAVA